MASLIAPSPSISIDEYDAILRSWQEMDTEAQSWIYHWREVNGFLMPRTGRFFPSDRNKGDRRWNNILDSTGTRAVRTLGAGMMSGSSSPARPWFRLGIGNSELEKSEAVQQWLFDVRTVMLHIFAKSNTYRALHSKYEECGTFGTAASVVMDDFDSVIHDFGLTIGEYRLTTDYRDEVNGLGRRFEKTVGQLVKEFGYQNCSQTVQNLFDRGSLGAWVPVIHIIQPREHFDYTKRDQRNMPFQSVYIEEGAEAGKTLRNAGFKKFRVLAPRWNHTPGNIYGEGQGMEALGDVKQLQHQQLRKAQGIDYQTNPPVQVPTSMKNRDIDRLPGGISYYDGVSGAGQGAIRNAFEVPIRLDFLLADIQDVRQRIDSAFFKDMFLLIANSQNGPQQTATEINEKHEEKMLVLGPVLENLHHEELGPRVELCFDRVLELGLAPPPPPELEGQELNIEFISVLAQAQRAIQTSSVDRFVMSLGTIAQMKPNVLDKFNEDEWADDYADMLGVDPKLIVPTKTATMVRDARAKAAAQQAQMQQLEQGANAANKLGNTPTDSNNALTSVLQGLQGYN